MPEPIVREYLANSLPVDEQFIQLVSQSLGIELYELQPFLGKPVQVFYSEGFCGGRIISAVKGEQDLEVPLAHESVFAGILLAAEVIIESMELRKIQIEPLTKINLLAPLHTYLREAENKNNSGYCICNDPLFTERYRLKWAKLL